MTDLADLMTDLADLMTDLADLMTDLLDLADFLPPHKPLCSSWFTSLTAYRQRSEGCSSYIYRKPEISFRTFSLL